MKKERKPIFQNETTIKLTAPGNKLILLAKTIAYVKQCFKDAVVNDSGIKQNVATGQYFTYLNLDSAKLETVLVEITPYRRGVRFD
jgi:hypothetical protein